MQKKAMLSGMQDLKFVSFNDSDSTNPLLKFLMVIFISCFFFIIQDLLKMYFVIVTVFLYLNYAKFPHNVAKTRYRALIVFSLAIFLVQILFVNKGEILFYLIPKVQGFGPFIPIYEGGVYQGFLLAGRLWGVILTSWVFVNSTNPFEYAQSLTKIGVPYRFAYTLSLALRFIPVLENEAKLVQNAQQARGLNISPSNFKGIINLLRYTFIPLIASTLNRIRDITISMDGRAFGYYTNRSYTKNIPFKIQDWMKLVLIALILMCFTLI
ncbi:MAG: energy-coupling factor transporter transmembrane protein EcfT [Candidatus Heimdallarchaeota archaeon]|nr:MAG: energy-coupling factor transporter transmembrane protein EcfT [Candidatus Heimdallarchaeota archaeon]